MFLSRFKPIFPTFITQSKFNLFQPSFSPHNRKFTISLFIILLFFLVLNYLRILTIKERQEKAFHGLALLITNPLDQHVEGSYGWYREQLESSNRLGNTMFKDPVMTRLGFQDTQTTSKDFFHYFRTFSTNEKCSKQHYCKVYADRTAGEYLDEGVRLDAVLHHCFYNAPFFLNSREEEINVVSEFQKWIFHSHANFWKSDESEIDMLKLSHLVDQMYGERIWRGMRRLSLLMCSESMMVDQIKHLTEKENDSNNREIPEATPDISICFLSTCSVWVNYNYNDISLSNSKLFGTKPFSQNKGICAFISNCDRGGTELQQRNEFLLQLSKYIPIRQYGKCGKNSQEGPGGKPFELENNCRFYYAAENSIFKDYVTEKFFEGVRALENGAKMIMLYRGAPNLRIDFGFPKSLFVDHSDFESVDELGRFLKKLNEDDDAFENWFARMNMQERKKIDKALEGFEYRLGQNIPCRICKIIGEMKLARYLLFKIGFKPSTKPKINLVEWNNFKTQRFSTFSSARLKILDEIYFFAYKIFQEANNKQNEFNLGWKFNN